MPIDEALDKIEERRREETTIEKTFEGTGRLEEDAAKVMGEFLVQYFNGELVGRKSLPELEDSYSEVLRRKGIEIINIIPELDALGRRLNVGLTYLTGDSLVEVLRILCGDYILETDLIKLAKESPNEIDRYMPELLRFKKRVTDDDIKDRSMRTTLHPHLFVMGMHPVYRHLATLSVDRAIKGGNIQLLREALKGNGSLDTSYLRNVLDYMTPPTRDCLDVAKEYGVKELIPVIDDYNRARDYYLKTWRGGI